MSACKRIFAFFLAFCLILPMLAAVPFAGSAASISPVVPEVAASNAITVSTVYKSITGINPANGHDLIYLLFKGNTMIVYDIDAREVYDTVTGPSQMPSTPLNACFDDENNLWVCGAGYFLYKYTPSTKTLTRFTLDRDLFMGIGNLYGITFYEGMLYFGTASHAHLGMMDPKTGKVTVLSDWLNTSSTLEPDAYYAAWGGMHIVDGYIYTTLDGDRNEDQVVTHQVIKFDLRTRRIVDYIDLSAAFKANTAISYLNYADGMLFPTRSNQLGSPIAIDITGSKMELVDISGISNGFLNRTSSKLNGKYYSAGYKSGKRQLFEYDPVTQTATALMSINTTLMAVGGVVTVDDSSMPGQSLVTYSYSGSQVNLVFYNPQTKKTAVYSDILSGQGSGNNLRAITTDPTGRYVYVGAYGYNKITTYDTQTGQTMTQNGYGHQTDALLYYDGYLWVGNYNSGTLTRFNTGTGVASPIYSLMSSVFQQKRMFGLAAGDGIVFSSTVPDTGMFGGTLNWYDTKTGRVYVAAGPNPEDVYYTLGSGWYSALTGKYESFDADGDGGYDTYITVNGQLRQRFYGVIENRCINSMVYKDGYIYGTTTKANGMGEGVDSVPGNAQVFVYDVAAMKVVAVCDLSEKIQGLATPIPYVNVIAEDPATPGKFWGIVSETLFSFTFDTETCQFSVKEELSLGKTDYKSGVSSWHPSSLLFDGDYLYATFGNQGTYMVRRSNPGEYYRLTTFSIDQMARGADGNIYFVDNVSSDIQVIRVGSQTQPLAAASVQAIIDTLPAADTMTAAYAGRVFAARAMYDGLTDTAKALVDIQKLTAAENALGDPDLPVGDPDDLVPIPTLPNTPTEPSNPTEPTDPNNPTDPDTPTDPNGSDDGTGDTDNPDPVKPDRKLLPIVLVVVAVLLAGGAAAFLVYKQRH